MCAAQLNLEELMLRSLRGAILHQLKQPAEGVWEFSFQRAGLNITCPWRIVSNGVIILAASDQGQKFGLPSPVDVFSKTMEYLHDATVESVEIDQETSDLCIRFSGGIRVDAFNDSSGYEGWNYADQTGVMLVAMGGGQLAIWDRLPRGHKPAPAEIDRNVKE
jgi:hypothetical protein